jgi:hypothetical protein
VVRKHHLTLSMHRPSTFAQNYSAACAHDVDECAADGRADSPRLPRSNPLSPPAAKVWARICCVIEHQRSKPANQTRARRRQRRTPYLIQHLVRKRGVWGVLNISSQSSTRTRHRIAIPGCSESDDEARPYSLRGRGLPGEGIFEAETNGSQETGWL